MKTYTHAQLVKMTNADIAEYRKYLAKYREDNPSDEVWRQVYQINQTLYDILIVRQNTTHWFPR